MDTFERGQRVEAQQLAKRQGDFALRLTVATLLFDEMVIAWRSPPSIMLVVIHRLAERELERGLLTHLRDLLLELGRGFAFVGSQVPLVVDGRSFYVDLLFYHLRLHCYFVIELKTGEFQPEYAGKLSFYISAIDGSMRTPIDSPTIESRSGPIVEYALQSLIQPIGVSTYRVTRELPAPVREELPSVEDLEEVVHQLRAERETLRKESSNEE